MGDFNIDLLKTDMHRPIHDYVESIYSNSMLPSIYKPTRITANTATCIDNILTNNENIIQTTILVNDTSDNMPIILSTNLDFINPQKHENKFIYKRNHCDDNISKFKKRLSEINWQEILDNNDANDVYNTFIERFNEVYDECIPLKKCTINRKRNPMSPWITNCLLKSINKKNKLYKQYIQSPNNGNLQKFKTYKNKLNMLISKTFAKD